MTRPTFYLVTQSARVAQQNTVVLGGHLARFDRYVLSRFIMLFGFFALVLVSVYWLNRAVILFDRLIADGHSAAVVLEFTALSLPNVVKLVLPIAAFAGTVYVTNRLSAESELTVVQATGFSPWRLARPALYFGLLVAVIMSVLTHFLVPQSLGQLRQREVELSRSISAKLVREGVFLHPASGVTFFIREITDDGELRDVLLDDRRTDDRTVTYTAQSAYLLRVEESVRLVMVNGLAQTLNNETNRLSTTQFDDVTYDITAMVSGRVGRVERLYSTSTWRLLFDKDAVAEETKSSLGEVGEELHMRFQQPLLGLVAAMIGFSSLMIGGYSRFGVGKQIVFAIFLLVVVKLVEGSIVTPIRSDETLWPLIYLPSLVGFGMVAALLHSASKPFRPARRRNNHDEVPA